MFRKLLDYAEAGDNIGRTFSVAFSVQKSSVDRVLAKPGSIHSLYKV